MLSRLSVRLVLIHLAIIAVFGVWWPRMRGADFFDPVFLSAYACLGVLFSAPAAAQAFADPPEKMGDALARIARAVLYGEIMAVAILAAGIATVLRIAPFGPDWIELAEAGALGLTGSLATASLAGWITLRYSPFSARQMLRVIFLALLILFFFKSRWLPDVVGRGISISLGIAILAIFGIQRALRSPLTAPK